jgi:hypothetical protein
MVVPSMDGEPEIEGETNEDEARTPRACAPPTTRPYRKFDVTVESPGVTHRGKRRGREG